MPDYKKAKGVLPQGGPAPEDLVRAARGDFEPLYREAQAENLRLRSALEQAQAQVAELQNALVQLEIEMASYGTYEKCQEIVGRALASWRGEE